MTEIFKLSKGVIHEEEKYILIPEVKVKLKH